MSTMSNGLGVCPQAVDRSRGSRPAPCQRPLPSLTQRRKAIPSRHERIERLSPHHHERTKHYDTL
jgi:hypothetical protein